MQSPRVFLSDKATVEGVIYEPILCSSHSEIPLQRRHRSTRCGKLPLAQKSTGFFIAIGFFLWPLQSTFAGTATATVTLNGKTFEFAGGDCVHGGGMFAVNIGTLPADTRPGTTPDYFGMTIMKDAGNFSDGALSFTKDGARHSVGAASGTATPSGAMFSGKVIGGHNVVRGSFSC